MKEKIEKVVFNPYAIISTLLMLVGGGGTAIYQGGQGAQGLGNKMDAILYLMCDKKQACVDSTWNHIIEQKLKRDMLSNGGN